MIVKRNAHTGNRMSCGLGSLLSCVMASTARAQNEQTVFEPVSDHAEGIVWLWWAMFWVGAVIFLAVMLLLAVGLWRARRPNSGLGESASRNLVIAAGVAIPLVILLTLVGGSLMLGRSIAADPPPNVMRVRVTGWMWWWQVDYLDQDGKVIASTANEIHVPVGRPVEVQLISADVIHSFWVPQLHGKTDVMPGQLNSTWFTAEKAGVYRGQCAEFCGVQHALMAFLVIAEAETDFRRWLERQAAPAEMPENPRARFGLEVFLDRGCASCHTVRGTDAQGNIGPDLTHLASRRTLAAVTIPNTRGHLGGWISDPHSVKEGVFMPRTLLEPEELTALTVYLETLE
ncbi:cytochrome c oxidase subunit II [Proteobacteria bacterium 005FR1]|nr:cytochrome c oxidase subunit II [Proteobacteria bacterium 005FR1]